MASKHDLTSQQHRKTHRELQIAFQSKKIWKLPQMCGRAQGGKSSVAELQLQRSPEICRVRMKQTGAPLPLPRPLSTKEEGVLHGEGTNLRTRRRPSSSPISPPPSTRTSGHGHTPGIPKTLAETREAACSDLCGRREPHASLRASRHVSPLAPKLNEACSARVGDGGWGGEGGLGCRDAHLPPIERY